MLWGIISLLICIILLLKYLSRKMKWQQLDHMLRKIHKPCGIMVCLLIVIHIVATFHVWEGRAMLLIITGIASVVLIAGMTALFFVRKKLGSRWLKYHRYGGAVLILLLIMHVGIYNMDFLTYKKNIAQIQVEGISAEDIPDGTYYGTYDVGYIAAKVEVEVQDEKIKEVKLLKHYNERGKKAEILCSAIVQQQNTKVDTVTGATNSSLVIEKAVENALTNDK